MKSIPFGNKSEYLISLFETGTPSPCARLGEEVEEGEEGSFFFVGSSLLDGKEKSMESKDEELSEAFLNFSEPVTN